MKTIFKISSMIVVLGILSSTAQAETKPQTPSESNSPQATGGANYDGEAVDGIEEYNKRRQLIVQRAEMLRREQEKLDAEYRAYLQRAKEQAAAQKASSNKSKAVSNQEYFDRQTKIMQGQGGK